MKIAAFSFALLVAACMSGCSNVRKDEDFSRNFLVRIMSGDPSIAMDMDSTLLSQAGSWQVVNTTIRARLPIAAIDSITFMSRKKDSSMPSTVRSVTLNVFGGQQYSVAEVFLETGKAGKTLVNTIRVQGPSTWH
jgi:hypothetical protein